LLHFLHFGTGFAGVSTLKNEVVMAVFGVDNIQRRKVPGYGGAYEAGSDGSVWRNGRELKQIRGYVNLSWKGRMDKVRVCYVVARAFVPNLEGKEWVRHKDGDPWNNRAENLEWSERKEATQGRRRRKVEYGAVSVWDKASGGLVGSWGSLRDACLALGVEERSVRRQLAGAAKSVKGYVFKV